MKPWIDNVLTAAGMAIMLLASCRPPLSPPAPVAPPDLAGAQCPSGDTPEPCDGYFVKKGLPDHDRPCAVCAGRLGCTDKATVVYCISARPAPGEPGYYACSRDERCVYIDEGSGDAKTSAKLAPTDAAWHRAVCKACKTCGALCK